jgi:tRNA(fMet)-specific endonuclease VapC
MKIADSTFLVDVINGKDETFEVLKKNKLILTTQINIFEIIRGIFFENPSDNKFKHILNVIGNVGVLKLDDDSMIRAADLSADLMRNGKSINDNDCLIAGIALTNNINTIITRDKHFDRIKGIRVETY